MLKIKIRKSSIEDFDRIVELFYQLWPGKQINKEELIKIFKKKMNLDNYFLLSAEYLNEVIGFSSLVKLDNFWQEGYILYITILVVDEKYRNQGVGKQLINSILEIGKENKCKKIELESSFSRVEAHNFYEKMGFEKRAYFFSRNVD
jgi:GNAT superfamily N-acetyltransferase